MSTLPLKALSRLWGKFNSLDIPYYLRVPGFRLYAWAFGAKYAQIRWTVHLGHVLTKRPQS